MDTTKLLVKIKKLEKIGFFGNQKPQSNFLGTRKIFVHTRFIMLPTKNFEYQTKIFFGLDT